MPFRFSRASEAALATVHPKMRVLAHRALALSKVDFRVIQGKRTLAEQRRLVAAGASRTLKSKHITGRAIDVLAYLDGKPTYAWPLYRQIADAFKQASKELGIPVKWGGDWRTFKDGPHFELPDALQ